MSLQQALKRTVTEVTGDCDRYANIYPGGYSGRGMYGRQCPAITGSWAECQRLIGAVIKLYASNLIVDARNIDDDAMDEEFIKLDAREGELLELIDALMDFRTDNLGRDLVLYWPEERYEIEQVI